MSNDKAYAAFQEAFNRHVKELAQRVIQTLLDDHGQRGGEPRVTRTIHVAALQYALELTDTESRACTTSHVDRSVKYVFGDGIRLQDEQLCPLASLLPDVEGEQPKPVGPRRGPGRPRKGKAKSTSSAPRVPEEGGASQLTGVPARPIQTSAGAGTTRSEDAGAA